MKTPHLLASFAVVTTVTAAELKDPSEVAHAWEANTTVLSQLTGDLSLRAQIIPPSLATWPVYVSNCWPAARSSPPRRNRDVLQVPPDLEAGKGFLFMVPDGDKLPAGAKPWNYRGQTFWLIPIASAGGK